MRLRSLAVATALTLLVSGCGSDTERFTGAVLDQPYHVDGTSLTDTEGRPFSLAGDTDARLTLVFYGYTHCPDICGIVMSSLASAFTRLDDQDRSNVEMVFVTTDPARDDERTLRNYLDGYNPEFVGLTGSLTDIEKVGSSMHVAIEKGQKLASGGYEVTHGTSVYAIDGSDEVPVIWTQGTSAAQFAADIHSLLGKA